jgi:hypothetical protein
VACELLGYRERVRGCDRAAHHHHAAALQPAHGAVGCEQDVPRLLRIDDEGDDAVALPRHLGGRLAGSRALRDRLGLAGGDDVANEYREAPGQQRPGHAQAHGTHADHADGLHAKEMGSEYISLKTGSGYISCEMYSDPVYWEM